MPTPRGVKMYDPSSDAVRSIHPEDVEAALEEGLEVETEQTAAQREYNRNAGALEAAKAVGEGLLSGATLGTSDVVLSELGGDEYREGRQLRQEAFGGFETAAEIAGGIIPVIATGGTGAAAKGAGIAARASAFTPAALAARGAAAAERYVGRGLAKLGAQGVERGILREAAEGALKYGAAGVVEGGAAGAGFALSEAALENQLGSFDAVAERAWAGAKSGAMFGLIGGAALGGLSGAARGSARALGRRVAQSGDTLAEAANERAVKALAPRATDIRKLRTEANVQQLGEDLRTHVLRDGTPVLEAFDNVESLAPKVARAKAEVGEELGALRAKVAAVGDEVDAKAFLKRVDNEVVNPLLQSESPDIQRIGRKVNRQLTQLRSDVAAREAGTPAALAAQRRETFVRLETARSKLGEAQTRMDGALDVTDRAEARLALAEARSELKSARQAVQGARSANEAAPVTYGRLLELQQDVLKPLVYPAKAPGAGITVQAPGQAELSRVERILEETMEGHVEQTLAKVAPDDVGKYRDVRRLYSSFAKADELAQKATKQNLGNRYVSLTDYITGVGAGAALFDGGLGAAAGLAGAFVHKQARERGSALLATLYTRTQSADQRLTQGFNRAFQRAREAARATRIATTGATAGQLVQFDVRRALRAQRDETPEKAYDRVIARANDVAQGRAVGPFVVDDVAPRTGHAMRGVQQRAAAHLVRTAPVPPRQSDNPNLGALSAEPKPDPVGLYEFARRVKAIDDPLSLLDDLQDGTISMAAVEAVSEVYPTLYASMRARVMDGLGASPDLLPYEFRVRVGVLFDLPTDPTLRPEVLAQTQAVYAQQRQGSPPATQSRPGASGSRSNRVTSMAEELETDTGEM